MAMSNRQNEYEHRRRTVITTGSGCEAGLNLGSRIPKAKKEPLSGCCSGDLDAPAATIFSEPQFCFSLELERNNSLVWECLKRTATAMAPLVDYYAIACNTLNHYQDRLATLDLRCRLVSVTDVVSDYIREQRLERRPAGRQIGDGYGAAVALQPPAWAGGHRATARFTEICTA